MSKTKFTYTPELCQKVIELGEQGKSWNQIATLFSTTRRTLYDYRQRYPEFQEAYMRSREACESYWEDIGQKGIKGILPKFNPTTYQKYMQVQFPDTWREVTEQRITLADEVKKLSDSDLDAKIKALEETRLARQLIETAQPTQ